MWCLNYVDLKKINANEGIRAYCYKNFCSVASKDAEIKCQIFRELPITRNGFLHGEDTFFIQGMVQCWDSYIMCFRYSYARLQNFAEHEQKFIIGKFADESHDSVERRIWRKRSMHCASG